MNDRVYVIIDASEVASVDFDAVMQTSAEHLRYSLDGSQTLVKFKRTGSVKDGEGSGEGDIEATPSFLVGKTQYNHDEIRAIMATEAWTEHLDSPE